jgi:8-oxo-dGTP pyrophosphatase MutT (NUDIX family)
MRQSSAAFAWIECPTPDGPRWLTQWNSKWQAFNLVGGHREQGESFRECVVRELVEELGISPAEFAVAAEPIAQIEFEAWSVPAAAMTAYSMVAFRAEILTAAAIRQIDENAENRWLSATEFAAATSHDGRRVSEVAVRFFTAIAPQTS